MDRPRPASAARLDISGPARVIDVEQDGGQRVAVSRPQPWNDFLPVAAEARIGQQRRVLDPPEEPEELELPPIPFAPPLLEPELEEMPAVPRVPEDTDPALRLAVLELLLGTDEMLLPTEEELTSPATDADLAVAALTRAEVS